MNFTIYRSSSTSWEEEKEIATLEELMAFARECHPHRLILRLESVGAADNDRASLEIYDDYME